MAISKLILNGVTQMDVTGTTAVVSDVASGKKFTLVDGTEGTGTASGGGGGGSYPWAGANAILYDTFTPIVYKLEDTGFATWTPSNTAAEILDAQTVGSINFSDIDKYDYLFLTKYDLVAVYQAGATQKALLTRTIRVDVSGVSTRYTAGDFDTGIPTNVFAGGAFANAYMIEAYGTSGALTRQTSGQYLAYPNSSPTISLTNVTTTSATATIKTAKIYARCSSSYCTTTNTALIDQAQTKFKITVDVLRVDRPSLLSGLTEETYSVYKNPL